VMGSGVVTFCCSVIIKLFVVSMLSHDVIESQALLEVG
jgi:hypothetical protein